MRMPKVPAATEVDLEAVAALAEKAAEPVLPEPARQELALAVSALKEDRPMPDPLPADRARPRQLPI